MQDTKKSKQKQKAIMVLEKNIYRVATQAVTKAGQYAYRDRKQKRTFRALWIVRINAAARMYDLNYSSLINGLNKAEIDIDRKILADLAMNDIETFAAIAKEAKSQLAA